MKGENSTKGLKDLLTEEQRRLKDIKEKTERNLLNLPEGSVRIGNSQGYVQYYHCKPGGPHNGEYIPKKDWDRARQLAQKGYDQKVLKCVDKRLSQIGKILRDYEDDEVEQLFLREHPEKRKLITPMETAYQDMVKAWMDIPYIGKGFKEGTPVILTNNGMRVRSKSEKIIADYFDSQGILYKYECPLTLNGYGVIYPDFTFLSPSTHKEIYWEHEGMMDEPAYAKQAVKKIELYGLNGLYIGERLILTFESSASVLNTKLLKEMTKKYLM